MDGFVVGGGGRWWAVVGGFINKNDILFLFACVSLFIVLCIF
jgi:hypothetical protein